MASATWTVWSLDERSGVWIEVGSDLIEPQATGQAARANTRFGRTLYVALPAGQEPGPEHRPAPAPPVAPPDPCTPLEAAHVLAHYGEGGIAAGGFTMALIAVIVRADPGNRARLALGFPGYVAAVQVADGDLSGIARLREIAGNLTR